MENNGEVVDDQGSGWFEVKKKHRSSSRFSVQSLTGDASVKNFCNHQLQQLSSSERRSNTHGKYGNQPPKIKVNLAARAIVDGPKSSSVPKENENAICFPGKSVIKQDGEESRYQKMAKNSAANCSAGVGDAKKILETNKLGVVPKIKWGDLENDVLLKNNENNFQNESKVDDTSYNDRKIDDNEHLVSNVSLRPSLQENNLAVLTIDGDICTNKEDSVEERCKEEDKIVPSNNFSKCHEIQKEQSKRTADNFLGPSCTSGEEAETIKTSEAHDSVSEVDSFEISKEAVSTDDHKMILQEGKTCNTEKPVPEISGEVETVTQTQSSAMSDVIDSQFNEDSASNGEARALLISCEGESPKIHEAEILKESTAVNHVEDCQQQLDGTVNNEQSKVQNTDAYEEGTAVESKERFRERLWCFLFENLNRAVDELYLLCELECDVEQMKESILVLEEASSDFKELTTRVQEFEDLKGSSSQSVDGLQITLKSDHRRPHALSWEVRRMTTSPHKAEILSSSLEAFRKIQKERAEMLASSSTHSFRQLSDHPSASSDIQKHSAGKIDATPDAENLAMISKKQPGGSDIARGNSTAERKTVERSSKANFVQNGHDLLQNSSLSDVNPSRLPSKGNSGSGMSKRDSESEKVPNKKEKAMTDSLISRNSKSTDQLVPFPENDKHKRNSNSWRSMNAWKQKRNWEDILSSPFRGSSRVSHSPGMARKSAERARILHDKLMLPEKKKKTALDLKKEAEQKHARALRIRNELENERVQKLQRNSEKLNRVNEWQAVRTMKLREGMYARQQRSESRHEAYLAQVARRAGDESSKVNEVRFITSLNEENKKLMLRQKLHDSELRRAEKLLIIKTKQKEDVAREEAVLERRKLIEAEKLQRLAEMQRRKEEAQVRREEERKASSAAREARAIEQLRRREERAKAQQEEAELLAQKLAERLRESEQRRKFYLEQIRERASMDFRDQSSPLMRRSVSKEGQGRSTPNGECYQESSMTLTGNSTLPAGNATLQQSLKRRIKKIRQRLMASKYEFLEPSVGENTGIGYRVAVGTARAKIGRWLQELQRLRQARKEGAASIGLITAEMIKFLEGKDPELQVCRQAGLLDFIASALPASHTSKPEACQVTVHLLKLLRVVLSAPANRSYFLAQNLLPPIIPMLSAALENYIKIAASLNVPGGSNLPSSKTSVENFESVSEVLDNFLWTVGAVMCHAGSDERELLMQDGLLELLVAYQVIHRLRDLFALYDRPLVEGSPFPSSILLSINLLVVLTYRPEARTTSSINWEYCPDETVLGFASQEAKDNDNNDFESTVKMPSEDSKSPSSVQNCSTAVSAKDVSEEKALDEPCSSNKSNNAAADNDRGERKPNCHMNNTRTDVADVADEPRRIHEDEDERIHEDKDEKLLVNGVEQRNNSVSNSKQPVAFLLSVISETGLVSLPSMLTAVLLQANNRLSSEQGSYILPCNFEEVATGALKVLNNLAFLDITYMQRMLARPDLKMEFFHLMSFLLSHCSGKWKAANDQVGLLLMESLSILGYFALFHSENQAVLRWGKSPTILHKVCDLPFAFFSDPELMPVLAGALVSACYGSEQNKGVVQQELSMDMLLSLLKTCRNLVPVDNLLTEEPNESNQQNSEVKKSQGDVSVRSSRHNSKATRGRVGPIGNGTRGGKTRNQRNGKATKSSDEMASKLNPPSAESSVKLSLRFPSSFIDKAEQFFSANPGDIVNQP